MEVSNWTIGSEPDEEGDYLITLVNDDRIISANWALGKWKEVYTEHDINAKVYSFTKTPTDVSPDFSLFKDTLGYAKPWFIRWSNSIINMAMVGFIIIYESDQQVTFWRQTIDDDQQIECWNFSNDDELQRVLQMLKDACGFLKIPMLDGNKPDIEDDNR